MSLIGESLKVEVYGESHGEKIGVAISGFPAGIAIDADVISVQLARRRPGAGYATPRVESDEPTVISGLDDGVTNGDTIIAEIINQNQHSADYDSLRYTPRPGHADYAARLKYGDNINLSGGGKFSGRLTAPLVFAGALCGQLLPDMIIGSHVKSIGNIHDKPISADMELLKQLHSEPFPVIDDNTRYDYLELIKQVRANGDSVGGVIELIAIGVPEALGDSLFDGFDGKLAQYLFGIPAVKGVEFGNGFAASELYGSQNNDQLYYDKNGRVYSPTNNCGGVLGGITNGMPLQLSVAFKPTPSISTVQHTINMQTKQNTQIAISGRHDPCIVARAAAVVEAVTAIAICDAYLTKKVGESHGA